MKYIVETNKHGVIGSLVRMRKLSKATLILVFTSIVAVGAVLVAGCQAVDLKRSLQKDKSASTYESVLRQWTAEDKLYRDIEPTILVTGTYKSIDFRRAYVKKYAQDYQLEPAEASKMLADQEAVAESNLEFLLAVSGPGKKERDLSSAESAWNVYLEGDSFGRLKPFEIRLINKKTAKLEGYFPYISHWARVYEIRFLAPDTRLAKGHLDLVITGILGTVRLAYVLED